MICSHTSLCHRNLQLLWKNALQQELLKISHLLLSFATFCSFRLDYHVHFILPPSIFPSLIVQIYLCLRFLLWRAAIHGVAKSRTRLIDWTELNWRFLMKSPKTRLGSFLAIIEDPVFTSLLAFVGLPRWLKGLIKKKKSTCNSGAAGDMGLIIGLGRSPGGGHGNPLDILARKIP